MKQRPGREAVRRGTGECGAIREKNGDGGWMI